MKELFAGRKLQKSVGLRWRAADFVYAVDPAEAGLHQYGVRSMYIWGLQIVLNFVPAMITETRNAGEAVIFCRHEIEFFCGQM